MTQAPETSEAIWLMTAEAIREQANNVLEAAVSGKLASVSVDLEKMPQLVERASQVMEAAYPDLQIPPSGCWRYLEADGIDRWGMLANARSFGSPEELVCSAADLAIVIHTMSVPLHPEWRWVDPVSGNPHAGREAIALAALSMFAAGSFSAEPADPLRADAHALIRLEEAEIVEALKLDRNRDATSIQSITGALHRLGETIGLRPDLFEQNDDLRPGCLAETYLREHGDTPILLPDVLASLLEGISPIWGGGATYGDVGLGDAFRHSQILGDRKGGGIVPFHLSAQEMAYSLIEPFAWAGVEVGDYDSLTGLANLEHALLFIDTGVIQLKRECSNDLDRAIEIRALSVALLDLLAASLREVLEAPEGALPLTCVMEGATLRMGTEIAEEKPEFSAEVSGILAAGAVNWLPFCA